MKSANPMIIGLVGYKNAGKTTLMKAIEKHTNILVNRIGFSEPLYKMLEVLGVTYAQIQDKSLRDLPHPKLGGKTIQEALNTLGTSWGRKMMYENIWTDRSLDAVISGAMNIADNVRFPNEYDCIRERRGVIVAIYEPDANFDGTEPERHIAELSEKADFFINNKRDRVTEEELVQEFLYKLGNFYAFLNHSIPAEFRQRFLRNFHGDDSAVYVQSSAGSGS